tara:strand:- start:638 stop:2413 length:1776 start_codon:yes stop_codon:yes gene_type:complete
MGAFIQGVARGVSDTVSEAFRKQQADLVSRVKRASDYHVARGTAANVAYKKKFEQSQEALEKISGFYNGDIDLAAQAIKAYGGVSTADDLYSKMRDMRAGDPNFNAMSQFAFNLDHRDDGGTPLTMGQAAKRLAGTTGTSYAVPQEAEIKATGMLGWLKDQTNSGNKNNVSNRVQERLGAMGIKMGEPEKLESIYSPAMVKPFQTLKELQESRKTDLEIMNLREKNWQLSLETEMDRLTYKAMPDKLKAEVDQAAATLADTKQTTRNKKQTYDNIAKYKPDEMKLALQLAEREVIKTGSGKDIEEHSILLDQKVSYLENEIIENNYSYGTKQYNDLQEKITLVKIQAEKYRVAAVLKGDSDMKVSSLNVQTQWKDMLKHSYMSTPDLGYKESMSGITGKLEVIMTGNLGLVHKAKQSAGRNFISTYSELAKSHKSIAAQIEVVKKEVRQSRNEYFDDQRKKAKEGKDEVVTNDLFNKEGILEHTAYSKQKSGTMIRPNNQGYRFALAARKKNFNRQMWDGRRLISRNMGNQANITNRNTMIAKLKAAGAFGKDTIPGGMRDLQEMYLGFDARQKGIVDQYLGVAASAKPPR